jgi:hypothetical protein
MYVLLLPCEYLEFDARNIIPVPGLAHAKKAASTVLDKKMAGTDIDTFMRCKNLYAKPL